MKDNTDYGKVISVRLKNSTIKKLEELKKLYSEKYNLYINNSELLKILINKELGLKDKKI